MSEIVPRRSQDGAKRAPRWAQDGHGMDFAYEKTIFLNMTCILPMKNQYFWPQDRAQMTMELITLADPGHPKKGSPESVRFGLQNGPKIGPKTVKFRVLFKTSFGTHFGATFGAILGPLLAPRPAQEAPRGAQESQRGLQAAKKSISEKMVFA